MSNGSWSISRHLSPCSMTSRMPWAGLTDSETLHALVGVYVDE